MIGFEPQRQPGRPAGTTKDTPSMSTRILLQVGLYPEEHACLTALCTKHRATKSGVVREALKRMHKEEAI